MRDAVMDRGSLIANSRKDLEAIVALLDDLDKRAAEDPGALARTARRYPYRHDASVEIEEGERRSMHAVLTRDLSATGLGFLAQRFMHPGRECLAHLTTLTGQKTPMPGKIVFCRYLSAKLHQCGMQFEQPIAIGQFVACTAELKPPGPDFSNLVSEFVSALPDVARGLEAAFVTGNNAGLARLARQLQGSAGALGFEHLSQAAAELVRDAEFQQDRRLLQVRIKELGRIAVAAKRGRS